MLVSQFDNSVAEDAGLLKMDFLGLKTLTIIRDAVRLVKQTHGIDLVPDDFPLDDVKTYELFQRGDTVGIFQYESTGMQKYLKELKPTKFEDVIAMNALYRPGPLEYIPEFIERKHGRKPVVYDLPEMEEYLEETQGITIYQEQVMLLSQKLADFSKGQADTLRKAMGKKKKALVDKMWPKFLEGCTKNGHPEKVVEKVWKDWEAFASYAFNKSHSTCYAFVAFQTAYLKAHYPAEFMASVLTHNKSDISKVTFFLRECKRMELDVLGPDVNESHLNFTVNQKGQIRFGMSALKGVGEGPVEALLLERKENGPFKNIFEMVRRLNLKAVNKRIMESMALGGGFDAFEGVDRAQYFAPSGKYDTLIEHSLKYGNAYQLQKAQNVNSLFGDSEEVLIQEPPMPVAEPWSLIEKLTREKEVTGIYISGHPLDDYKMEVDNFTTCSLEKAETIKGQQLKLAGIVAAANHRISKKGTGFGFFTIQDYNGSMEFPLFSEDYQKYKHLFEVGQALYIHGTFQKKWSGDDYQFKISKVELLENVAANMTSSLTLRIPIESLTKELVHNIEMTCKAHEGKHKLKVHLIDRATKTKLQLVAKTQMVNADNDLISKLKKLGVAYQVN